MDFSFDEEQTLLRTSLSKLLNEVYDFGSRQKIVYGDPELSNKIWTRFSELGLTALPFDENLDGLGGRPSDIVAVSELFGKFAVVEPYLSVVFLSQLLRQADPEQHRSLVEDVMTGRSRIALAHEEPHDV
ncbi:MAG: acyl-CoA dehydrogenase family protein, partial [Pseudomonadota bacterium]